MYFVVAHKNKKEQLLIVRSKIEIIQRIIGRQNGKWHHFKQKQEIFLNKDGQSNTSKIKEHPYATDLDIFGKNSLFQFMNEANTYYGIGILTEMLTVREDLQTILYRQAAAEELSEKVDFYQELLAYGNINNINKDPQKLISFLEQKNTKLFNILKYVYVFPAALIISAITFLIWPSQNMLFIITTIILIQGLIFAAFLPKTSPILSILYGNNRSLRNFKSITSLIEAQTFKSPLNTKMQSFLSNNASKFIGRLSFIESAANLRNSMIIFLALNFLFLWDILLVVSLEKLKGQGNIKVWLKTIGFFEAMASVANINVTFQDWVTPKFDDTLSFTAASHPLLANPVANDYNHISISIITGSNMSGKTTFLRTIGINLVLANMGAKVRAKSFTAPIVDIYTCMRTTDSLTENISTFYGELQRIKLIINRASSSSPMLFLIDEIFRGTNSEDRITGAKMVLRKLNQPHIIGLITTHDLSICDISIEGGYKNYNFREYYEENEIKFDYKIREGVSTTRNAMYLMKLVGIE